MEALTEDRGLKATAWIQTTLFDQQRNMYVCIKRAFYIQARGVSLKICLLLVQDEAIYIIKDLNSFILGSHGHRLPNFQPGNVAWIPQLESVNLSGYSQASLLVCSLLSDQNCRFFFFLIKTLMWGTWLSLFLSHLIARYKVYLLAGKARSVLIFQAKEKNGHL